MVTALIVLAVTLIVTLLTPGQARALESRAVAVIAYEPPGVTKPGRPMSWAEARSRPVLRSGMTGPWVKFVTRRLEVSARKYNSSVRRAVRQFQRAKGISPDAVVAASTWWALGKGGAPVEWLPLSVAQRRPVLEPGADSDWCVAVQKALRVSPTSTNCGPATREAVATFQRKLGLDPTGVVNAATWRRLGNRVTPPTSGTTVSPESPGPALATIDPDAAPRLGMGQSSHWVVAVQRSLRVSPTSGYFGTVTESAVQRFQRSKGLTVTGVVNRATWRRLVRTDLPPVVDPTQTDLARASREHRATISRKQFARSATAAMVTYRESRGDCTAVSPTGKYRGKWQMDANFWEAYGGLSFSRRPDLATCAEQDKVARRGWVARHWQPWPTAG